MTGRDHVELAVHAAVVEHFAVRGARDAVMFHIAGNPRNARDGARLKRLGLKAGMADLAIIRGGRIMLLEIKREGGQLSPVQRAVKEQCENAGAICATGYGLSHCLQILEAWNVLLRSVRA